MHGDRLVTLHNSDDVPLTTTYTAKNDTEEKTFRKLLHDRTIGSNAVIETPFGKKRIAYFDYIASGRLFRDIEDELNEKVLPYMANTHTESTYTGRLMTRYYHQAAKRIGAYVNASAKDVVIFTGSGCTGSINKMIRILGIRLPDQLDDKFSLRSRIPDQAKPVIFSSLMEHHSNDLAWRETIGDTVYIEFDEQGKISLVDLEIKLIEYAHRPFKIGTFSAGSNVTGVTSDTYEIAKILHRHGALAFFDFAAAGPYEVIDMNPVNADDPDAHLAYKDGVFISTHKFTGGPGPPAYSSPRKHFSQISSSQPGGGTVLYTSPWEHQYLPDIEARESGGTPPIIQVIQAGLVFDLKERIGIERTKEIEHSYLHRAWEQWRTNPHITLLGHNCLEGLGILSIIVKDAHHNLITTLLNDLYGIQARSGCMCAGPYGHDLLGIDKVVSHQIQSQLVKGHIGIKPGWVRISFSPVTPEGDFKILLEGVDYVTKNWRQYLDKYKLLDDAGEFVFLGS